MPGANALQPGEVRIRGQFSAINFKDALSLLGKAPIARRFPLVVGQDLVGVITKSRHRHYKPGQQVIITGCDLGEIRHGTFAPETIAPGDCVMTLPDNWPAEVAAAIGTAGFTAAYALLKLQQAGQQPEDGPILITGASGGVGSHAITLLSREGFEVMALSRKNRYHDALKNLGARQILSSLPVEIVRDKPLLPPQWAAAIDTLGGDTLAYLLASTQSQGNVVCLGLAQSPHLHTTVLPFILRGINLLGLTASHAPLSWRKRVWRYLFDRISPASYRIPYQIVPLKDAKKAAGKLLAGDNFGRVVLDLGTSSQD